MTNPEFLEFCKGSRMVVYHLCGSYDFFSGEKYDCCKLLAALTLVDARSNFQEFGKIERQLSHGNLRVPTPPKATFSPRNRRPC